MGTKSNNFCIQRPSSLGGAQGKEFFVGTEDCLYLDVIAPAKTSTKSYPVMFWIHGGGNTSGLKDLYDFNKIVKKHDVVVVRINYRLGPFGWFTHPAIQDLQEGLDKSSNLLHKLRGYKTPKQLEVYLKLFTDENYKNYNSQEEFNKFFEYFVYEFDSK